MEKKKIERDVEAEERKSFGEKAVAVTSNGKLWRATEEWSVKSEGRAEGGTDREEHGGAILA